MAEHPAPSNVETWMQDLSEMLDTPTDEERLLAESAAALLSGDAGVARARRRRGVAPGYDPVMWRTMADMGWTGLGLPEAWGGSGGALGLSVALAREMGRALASEPLIASAVLAGGVIAHSENTAIQQADLPRLAAGDFLPALAWQEPGRALARNPAVKLEAGRADQWRLSGQKCFVFSGGDANAFLVTAQAPDGLCVCRIDPQASGLMVRLRPRVDGGFWADLELQDVAVAPAQIVARGAVAERALRRALDDATLAVSAELVGLMQQALAMSVDYIRTRQQFGQPIGAFQALQHKAVDLTIALEIARSVLVRNTALYEAAGDDDARRSLLASQTKARCSDAALLVTKGCIQLHGGMGYTDEADIGLYLKRAMVLAAWLGGAAAHRARWAELYAAGARAQDDGGAGTMTEVRAWLEANFPKEMRFPDHRLDWSSASDWLDKLHAQGWAAPNWPRELGGMGLSAYEQVGFQEECDRVGMNVAPNLGASMLGPLLIRYGTDAQRADHLPGILSGAVRWCQGYSEPGAGSDLASLRTSAVIDGDDFVVNGQKIWTSFAYDADQCFLLVRTDKSARKQDGISFLLVDMDTPGITVRRIKNLTGSAEFCEVFFDNVRVPRENIVGAMNQGWKMAKSLLGSERIMVGSPRLARYPLRLLGEYARTHGLDADPVFRQRLTELELDVEDLSAAFVRFVDVLRRGGELGAEVSILKIWITETFQRVADLLLETAAETGTLDEAAPTDSGMRVHAANLFLAARAATIYGGSSEIQRNILAKMVLHLPNT